ncbi:bifunctional folylpolyglutamate synthase/dihydrofolate synthase [Luteimonas sp. SX5]|uniref:Dihydrofolate synthase/folylpolyglutamate synthase n=1 Tax=Luteimonas galliterrae TaxID=2940486 RepID=A0ABT0MHG1_9GAMM|nr:folylpolyglutamate synthase/dihydrofolate synthase family protein [Luteimonas galliterrae]MCL1634310.1 bifunctional folylpolyglutamate synthase/dihydrofolate synthase [Luteimonas galliterrae]
MTGRSLADWLAYIERQHPKSIDMGLERVREVAERLDLGKPGKHVVTIGGTNGKGSTVAFIEAIARAAGWKVGAYTSPHLLAYNERVRIDGRDAGGVELVEAFEAIEAARLSPSPLGRGVGVRVRRSGSGSDMGSFAVPSSAPSGHLLPEGEGKAVSLSYFEYGTLAALWLFERSQLDLAILEVGLGGRLDATNIVDPDVAVITTVDLDHQDYLGDDREKIGLEKAGIARPWKPLVLGEDDPPSSVLRHAYAIGASALRAGSDFFFERIDGGHWRWREIGFETLLPMPQLAAPAQLRNAATAIAALRALDAAIPEQAYAHGVAAARIAGRLQAFDRDGVQVLVDVGHNPQAARELAAWLRSPPHAGRTLAVFAALGDKDVAGVAAAIGGGIDGWFLAGLADVNPRGLDVDAFAQRLQATAAGAGARHATVPEALAAAMARARPGDRILVFGSFHTAAAAILALEPRG